MTYQRTVEGCDLIQACCRSQGHTARDVNIAVFSGAILSWDLVFRYVQRPASSGKVSQQFPGAGTSRVAEVYKRLYLGQGCAVHHRPHRPETLVIQVVTKCNGVVGVAVAVRLEQRLAKGADLFFTVRRYSSRLTSAEVSAERQATSLTCGGGVSRKIRRSRSASVSLAVK